jgi:hypothetical protein
MPSKTRVALALLYISCQTLAVAQSLPAPAAQSETGPSMLRVATIVDRIEHDRQDIRVYEASRPLELPWYSEMAIAVPRDRHASLESLQGSSVGLVRNDKSANEWALYSNVVAMGGGIEGRTGLTLADNVFRVRKVIPCTPRHAIELRMGGWVYRVKPGQVLLVLG